MPCGLLLMLVLYIAIAGQSQAVSSQLIQLIIFFFIKYKLDFTRELV